MPVSYSLVFMYKNVVNHILLNGLGFFCCCCCFILFLYLKQKWNKLSCFCFFKKQWQIIWKYSCVHKRRAWWQIFFRKLSFNLLITIPLFICEEPFVAEFMWFWEGWYHLDTKFSYIQKFLSRYYYPSHRGYLKYGYGNSLGPMKLLLRLLGPDAGAFSYTLWSLQNVRFWDATP